MKTSKNNFCLLLNKNPKIYDNFYAEYLDSNKKTKRVNFGNRYGFWLYERRKTEFFKAYKKYIKE